VGRQAAHFACRRCAHDGGKTTIYASWNGATEVASWRVLGGPSEGRLAAVTTAAKSGFETAIPVPSYKSFKLEALAADGRVIGASRALGL